MTRLHPTVIDFGCPEFHPEWQLFAARLAGEAQVADDDVHVGAVGYRDDATPNPVLARDARTLIGMLAYLEGALVDGSVTEDWAKKTTRSVHPRGAAAVGGYRP
jgi:hypothetical protein